MAGKHFSQRSHFSFVIDCNGKVSLRTFALLLSLSVLPFVGAVIDRSLVLPGKAVGILEHYGNMCSALVLPIVYVFCMRGFWHLNQFVSDLRTSLIPERFEKKARLRDFLQFSCFRGSYLALSALLITIGLAFSTANAVNTWRPEAVWGHDVYDSSRHVFGYIGQRLFFYVWWAYLLPVLVCRLCVVMVRLNKLFGLIIDTDSLVLHPMHPDNAGGMGEVGKVAVSFNTAILLTMTIPATLYYTHGYNIPLMCGMIVQFLLLPAVFFLPMLRVHAAMKTKKKALLLEISKHYQRVSAVLVQKLAVMDNSVAEEYDRVENEFEREFALGGLYRSLERMPTWPFDMRTITQFSLSILLPVVLSVLELVR